MDVDLKTPSFRAYKKRDLSKDKLGPDNISYEGVKYRIKKGKHIRITYVQGYKNPISKELFLDYAISQRIIRSLELLDKVDSGDIILSKKTIK